MDLYLLIAIVLVNSIAIGIVYQFIKKLENKQKLIIIAISIALMYILVSITYWISGFGIAGHIHEQTKNFIIYMFVPVNVILFIPYLASQYMKLKSKKIKIEKFLNKVATLIVLLIVVLVVEYFYFCNVQENIIEMEKTIEQNKETNNEELKQNIMLNETLNTIKQNEIVNEEINEIINEEINEIKQNVTVNETRKNKISSNQID